MRRALLSGLVMLLLAAGPAWAQSSELTTAKQWSQKGIAAYKAGKYQEAIRCFQSALNRNPGYYYAYGLLAAVYLRTGQNNQAIRMANQGLRRSRRGEKAQGHFYGARGLARLRLGQASLAVKDLETALRILPNHPRYTVWLKRARKKMK